MKRFLLGGFAVLVMLGLGLFWLQGRAEVEQGAPPPVPAPAAISSDTLPQADVAGMRGPAPPVASELTREQRRFFRYDRNRDLKITRNEMLSSRTDSFRDLDADGNNLLTFEEWAVTTVERFEKMDGNGDDWLTPAEFATSAPKPRASPVRPGCNC